MTGDDKTKYQNISGTDILDKPDTGERTAESKSRYTQRQKIGEGGQAAVYKIFDTKLSAYRAMKIIHPEFCVNKDFIHFYKNEVRFTSQLNHPNIVKVYDADTENDRLFIIMDYIEGKPLTKFKSLPVAVASIAISKAAEAAAYAHQAKIRVSEDKIDHGLVHGDIKPENMIAREDGEIMLTDFGLATVPTGVERSSTNSITMCSQAYAAPEIYDNKKPSVKTDIYALGVSLTKLITGYTGFEDLSQAAIIKSKFDYYINIIDKSLIPKPLLEIIEKATHPEIEKRYDSVEEFKDDLDSFLENNYIINNTYTNILGAYLNFKTVPETKTGTSGENYVAKQSLATSRRGGSLAGRGGVYDKFEGESRMPPPPPHPTPTAGSTLRKIILPVAAVLVLALAIGLILQFTPKVDSYELLIVNESRIETDVWINDRLAGTIGERERSKRFPLEKEGDYRVLLAAEGYEDVWENITLTGDEKRFRISYSPPEEIPVDVGITEEKYVLIIQNPQGESEDVFLNNRIIGNLDGRRTFIYDNIAKSGRHTLKVGDIIEDIYISEPRYTWQYEPPEVIEEEIEEIPPEEIDEVKYTLMIRNIHQLAGDVYIDGDREGALRGHQEVQFTLGIEGEKNIVIKSPDKDDFSQTVIFSPSSPLQSIVYDPDEPEVYTIRIHNPDGRQGTIYLNDKEESFEEAVFQKTFDGKQVVNVLIQAEFFEDVPYTADFSEQESFTFTYRPQRKKGQLIVSQTPDDIRVSVDGKPVSHRRDGGDIIIPDLPMGKKISVSLESMRHQDYYEEIKLHEQSYRMRFTTELQFGNLSFRGLSPDFAANSFLVLDNKEYPLADDITDLPVGRHDDAVFLFRSDNYIKRSNPRTIQVRPAGQGKTTFTPESFGVDVISVRSNRPQTRIYESNQFVGNAPVDIPIMNELRVNLRAETGDTQETKRLNMETLSDRNVMFRFPSPEAEALFSEAGEYYDQQDYLNADRILNQVIEIDNLHEDALMLRFEIVSSQLEESLINRQQTVFKRRLDQAVDYLDSTIEGLSKQFNRFVVLKDLGKYKYEYADVFIGNDTQKRNYFENNVLATLLKARNKRSTSGLLGLDYFHLDEAECYLAKTFQRLYELTDDEGYKKEAIAVWQRNPFRDYNPRRGGRQSNPFRPIKEEWYSQLAK